MKFWIVIFLACTTFIVLFYPPVNKERLCYDAGQTDLDAITSDIIMRGISKNTQCERSADILYTLESCIKDATKSSAVAVSTNDMINKMVSTVRMSGNTIWTLKADHNEQCTDFSQTQVP